MEELESGQQEMQEKIAQMMKWWRTWQKEKRLLMIPVYKESLRLRKMASIHLLWQIKTTFVNKED